MNLSSSQRQTSLDAMRIFAMLLIVLHHYNVRGGGLAAESSGAVSLQGFSEICVNLFVLLTGYFQVLKMFRWQKVLQLWGMVAFYSIGFMIVKYFYFGTLSFRDVLAGMFPLTTRAYWFITVYFVLYLSSPFLNRMLRGLDKKSFLWLLSITFVFTSIFPTFLPKTMALNPNNGYTFSWFFMLYCTGAYLQCYYRETLQKHSTPSTICGFVGYVLLACLLPLICSCVAVLLEKMNCISGISVKLMFYNSPIVFAASLFCFCGFAGLRMNIPYINVVAPLVLGVYLIHDNHFVCSILYTKILHSADTLRSAWYPLIAVGNTILIFCVCCVIEKGRQSLFGWCKSGVEMMKSRNKR